MFQSTWLNKFLTKAISSKDNKHEPGLKSLQLEEQSRFLLFSKSIAHLIGPVNMVTLDAVPSPRP